MLGPIFTRELVTVPRRGGHYAGRMALIGLLGILGITTWQATIGFARDATLGETASFGLLLFQIVAFVQLLLTLFFAALSAAGAVSQEKDRRTFVLLLLTDMRDYEIVLGKLLGALLPILDSATGLGPGAGHAAALGRHRPRAGLAGRARVARLGGRGRLARRPDRALREKTYQALALSVLFLVLYICLTQALDSSRAADRLRSGLVHGTSVVRPVRRDADRARAAGRRWFSRRPTGSCW